MSRWWRPVAALIALALVFGGPDAALAKSYRALRYDVNLVLEPRGSLVVTEEVVFRFEGGPFTRVQREVPTRRTDGIREVEALLDGQRLARGDEAGQVGARIRDRRLHVTWHLPGVSDQTHTFTLRYRVDGVVFQREDADVLEWLALPVEHDYAIDESTVRVTWPGSASLVGVDAVPRRFDRGAEFTGTGAERLVRLAGLGRNASVELRARFERGTLLDTAPQWQQRERRAEAIRPRALALAGGVFAALCGLFLLLWIQSPRGSDDQVGGTAYEPEPPDHLSPALAATLAANGAVGAMSHVATLFDLASRGVLRIDEQPKRGWGSRRFTLARTGSPTSQQPHERLLLDAVFEDGAASVDFQKVAGRVRSESRALDRAVRAELLERRWLDPDRDRARRRLQGLALLLFLVAGIGLVPPLLMLARLGPWPLLIPAAAALSAGFGLILASSISPLSDAGQRLAARCRAFAHYLRDVTRGNRSVSAPEAWGPLVAYAAALGLGAAWAKQMAKHGVPGWFHGLAGEADPGAAFVSVMTAGSHAAGHGGAGGAGGGAAGGGSSGAS